MNKVLTASFQTEADAYKGLTALKELDAKGDITLYGAVVLVSDASGTVSVKENLDQGPVGTALGAMAGALVGLLGGPIGVILGTGVGGASGFLFDTGQWFVSGDFVNQVRTQLTPGKAAILAEVDEDWMTPVDSALGQLGAVISRQPRAEFVADQMTRDSDAFDQDIKKLKEQIAQANAEDRASMQHDLDTLRKQRDAARAKAEANLQQAEYEADARVRALQDQIKHANAQNKANIEGRIADAKAKQKVLAEKWKQFGERAKVERATELSAP